MGKQILSDKSLIEIYNQGFTTDPKRKGKSKSNQDKTPSLMD